MNDMMSRSLAAVFWGGGGAAVRVLLQLVTQIVLARLLGPDQYGLFAIGAIVISFSNFFSSFGIAYGLIQKQEVTDEDLSFVFTWQLIIGLLVTGIVAAMSGPIALFFGDQAAHGVVAALAVVCLLNALMAPAQNMLTRNLDFKRIQIAQILGYVGGYVVVGVPMALSGSEVWALVVAWIVQACITLVILYSGAPHPLRLLFWFGGAEQMSRYGATVFVTNITNWVIGNIERVLIGRYFSSREIGLYATSYNCLYSPTATLLSIVHPVFFSAAARLAQSQERVAHIYLSLIALTAMVVLPVFASVSAISETFVLALYGTKWVEAAKLVTPLALAMPLFIFWGLTTPLLWLGGAPQREFQVQLPIALLWVCVSWFAAQRSVETVAWALVVLFALRYALILAAARKLMPLPLNGLWRALRGGLLVALACAAFVSIVDAWLKSKGLAVAICLLADCTLTIVFYLGLLTSLSGVLPAHCGELLDRLAASGPTPFARWLRRLSAME